MRKIYKNNNLTKKPQKLLKFVCTIQKFFVCLPCKNLKIWQTSQNARTKNVHQNKSVNAIQPYLVFGKHTQILTGKKTNRIVIILSIMKKTKQTAVIDNTNYAINVNGDLLNLKTNKFKK